jgi:hypothetical protein
VYALVGTHTHPVYSEDRCGYVGLGDLEVGERVRTAEGWATVEAMARWWGSATVHNLEVEAQHRFLAGAAGVVSHNAGGGGGGGSCGGGSCGPGSARFVADDRGNIVDTRATPPGRYVQPDGSATDILQKASHPGLSPFDSRTHTHQASVNQNPANPSQGSTRWSKHPQPVSTDEVLNIVNGIATPSTPRGR